GECAGLHLLVIRLEADGSPGDPPGCRRGGLALRQTHRETLELSLDIPGSFAREERGWLHRRQQMLPDEIEDRLHVADATGDGEHGILLGHHEAELAEGAVAPVRPVAAAPELVAVALRPVAVLARAVGDLLAGRLLHPARGHKLAVFPLPF